MSTDAIQPSSPSKFSSSTSLTTTTRSGTNTNTNTNTNTTTTTSSLGSSRHSLATLRNSLPDNPLLYDISEIRKATNNFLAKNTSSSSSTRSWHCTLRTKDVIIVQRKCLTQLSLQTVRRKLSSVCRSHHVAIVNLLGASVSGEYIYFVYDFIRGASLAELLHNPKNPGFTILSSWMSRVQIASDIANGLDYIHNSTGLDVTFVHNHVKSSSVIVSEPCFNAKLCHFGVSELCGEPTEERAQRDCKNGEIVEIVEEGFDGGTTSSRRLTRSNSVKFNGTIGYMSPEFQATGVGTRKSDVYAFGIVLIELLSGEEPLKYKLDKVTKDYRKISAVDAAITVVENGRGLEEKEGRIRKWVDRRLKDSYPVDVAEKLTRLAVDCVHVDPDKRPDMRRVAGKISKLYLESHAWCEKMSFPTDFTVSFAPR